MYVQQWMLPSRNSVIQSRKIWPRAIINRRLCSPLHSSSTHAAPWPPYFQQNCVSSGMLLAQSNPHPRRSSSICHMSLFSRWRCTGVHWSATQRYLCLPRSRTPSYRLPQQKKRRPKTPYVVCERIPFTDARKHPRRLGSSRTQFDCCRRTTAALQISRRSYAKVLPRRPMDRVVCLFRTS